MGWNLINENMKGRRARNIPHVDWFNQNYALPKYAPLKVAILVLAHISYYKFVQVKNGKKLVSQKSKKTAR